MTTIDASHPDPAAVVLTAARFASVAIPDGAQEWLAATAPAPDDELEAFQAFFDAVVGADLPVFGRQALQDALAGVPGTGTRLAALLDGRPSAVTFQAPRADDGPDHPSADVDSEQPASRDDADVDAVAGATAVPHPRRRKRPGLRRPSSRRRQTPEGGDRCDRGSSDGDQEPASRANDELEALHLDDVAVEKPGRSARRPKHTTLTSRTRRQTTRTDDGPDHPRADGGDQRPSSHGYVEREQAASRFDGMPVETAGATSATAVTRLLELAERADVAVPHGAAEWLAAPAPAPASESWSYQAMLTALSIARLPPALRARLDDAFAHARTGDDRLAHLLGANVEEPGRATPPGPYGTPRPVRSAAGIVRRPPDARGPEGSRWTRARRAGAGRTPALVQLRRGLAIAVLIALAAVVGFFGAWALIGDGTGASAPIPASAHVQSPGPPNVT